MSEPSPPKTNPVFFSLPAGYFDWPEAKQRAWMDQQAESIVAKLKPDTGSPSKP